MVGQFSTTLGDKASTLRARAQSNVVIAVGDELAGSAPVDWGKCTNPDAESRHCSQRRSYVEVSVGQRLEVHFRDRPSEDFLKPGQPLALRQFVGQEPQKAEVCWSARNTRELVSSVTPMLLAQSSIQAA